ncbi:hypothetical protein O181_056648 [Austropuccinia psidii MF-1]|uniref:Uncharacterized protein n=1 Tax=Austropuccinia psidii MF-1 TaxID=1389203 RepID=A0A9Q3E9Y6_9BASI|nr:hypothetical protein [Austropuccinia psidii MF-1]
MPVKHSPPAKNTRFQRGQAVLTPRERAPLDFTPSFYQISENLERVTPMQGEGSSRRGEPRSILEKSEHKYGEESVEEEESEETEVAGSPEASEAPNLAPFNEPLVSQSEPNFLKMMEQMTQFMGQLTQAVAPRDN